jgi:hypothetical protein
LSKDLIREGWEELVGKKNLKSIFERSPENLRTSTAREYALAGRLLKDEDEARFFVSIRGRQEDAAWQRREAYLAAGLERRWAMMERGGLAYVGGWQHLLCATGSGTLFERVAHLRPRRLLLGEYHEKI